MGQPFGQLGATGVDRVAGGHGRAAWFTGLDDAAALPAADGIPARYARPRSPYGGTGGAAGLPPHFGSGGSLSAGQAGPQPRGRAGVEEPRTYYSAPRRGRRQQPALRAGVLYGGS